MTHPLTDEICLEITNRPYMIDARKDDMRAAADWQLEQVMKWLEETQYDYTYDAHEDPERVFDYMDDKLKKLRKAMRPQENNS